MKILILDIETSPNKGYFWGLWNQNIPIYNIKEDSTVLCWAAKWYGEDTIMFKSNNSGHKSMIRRIHQLINQADAIIHFNGNRFDIPVLNKEFLLMGLPPPSPSNQIDLYKVAKNKFKFTSNKLDFIGQKLGVGKKYTKPGPLLWEQCIEGDAKAWEIMEKYNKQDVILTEGVYERFKPWIKGHANHSVDAGVAACPNCGSQSYNRRGYHKTLAGKYQRYQCNECGSWFTTGTSVAQKPINRSKYIG